MLGSVPHRHGDAEAHEEEVDEDDPDAGIEVGRVRRIINKEESGSPQEGRQFHSSFAYTQIPESLLRIMRQGKDETLQIANGSIQKRSEDVR